MKEFRQYRNQCYIFDKHQGKTDLHIIHGKNGVGKTNLLNAISWCLYDKELHLRNEQTAIQPINSQYVNEVRKRGGGLAEMFVSMEFREDKVSVTFKRHAEYQISDVGVDKYNGYIEITSNDNEEYAWQRIIDEELIVELIHKYVPEELNPYIFFDGEQMERFFSPEHGREIEKGIYNWTQVAHIEKAQKAFSKYVKDIEDQIKAMGDSNINVLKEEKDEAERNVDTSFERISLYQKQIRKCDDKINECTMIIGGHENLKEKVDRMTKIDNRLIELDEDKATIQSDMMKFAREQFFNHAIYPSLKSFYDYIKRQDELGKLPPRIDKLWLRSMLANHKCGVCGRDTDAHAEHIIKELEYSLGVASNTSAELNKAMGALTEFFKTFDTYEKDKQLLMQRISANEHETKKLEKERTDLDRFLRSVPDNKRISDAITERDEYQELKLKTAVLEATEQKDNEELQRVLVEKTERYNRALAKNGRFNDLEAKRKLCEGCVSILNKLKFEILNECRMRIQNETFKHFNSLVWKKNAFSDVRITEDYTFQLLDKFGNQTIGSCSAAEGALLALSFTLALQDVAGHNSLLFIDTPLGRVDDENRENFIETLLTIAKDKQVILTFTPTEYSDNVKKAITNQFSTFTEIQMNSEGITSSK